METQTEIPFAEKIKSLPNQVLVGHLTSINREMGQLGVSVPLADILTEYDRMAVKVGRKTEYITDMRGYNRWALDVDLKSIGMILHMEQNNLIYIPQTDRLYLNALLANFATVVQEIRHRESPPKLPDSFAEPPIDSVNIY